MNIRRVGSQIIGFAGINKNHNVNKYNQSFLGSLNFGNSAIKGDIISLAKGTAAGFLFKFAGPDTVQKIQKYFSTEE